MKRIISAFLLVIMTFASIQTTWDWHYCGGILRSVTLADKNKHRIFKITTKPFTIEFKQI